MPYRTKANIDLGDVAKDVITGYTGTVIARTRWLSNCDRLTLQPQGAKDGKIVESRSFDLPGLEFVKRGTVEVIPVIRPDDAVELGDEIQDGLTNLKGVCVAHTVWLNGCSRVTIQPRGLKDGLPVDPSYADEKDIKILRRAKPRPEVKTGGPRPEPVR